MGISFYVDTRASYLYHCSVQCSRKPGKPRWFA